jgi:hypothetical protein
VPKVLANCITTAGVEDGLYYFMDFSTGIKTTGANYFHTLIEHAHRVRWATR